MSMERYDFSLFIIFTANGLASKSIVILPNNPIRKNVISDIFYLAYISIHLEN